MKGKACNHIVSTKQDSILILYLLGFDMLLSLRFFKLGAENSTYCTSILCYIDWVWATQIIKNHEFDINALLHSYGLNFKAINTYFLTIHFKLAQRMILKYVIITNDSKAANLRNITNIRGREKYVISP